MSTHEFIITLNWWMPLKEQNNTYCRLESIRPGWACASSSLRKACRYLSSWPWL